MSELTRRELFIAFGAAGLLKGESYAPQFFTPHEYATLRVLVDFIIPADENSKGAIDAGAAEFIDFICAHSDITADIAVTTWVGSTTRCSGAVVPYSPMRGGTSRSSFSI